MCSCLPFLSIASGHLVVRAAYIFFQRREEEKRLQDEEDAKRELARQERIRLAEERVVDERRARQLQEREEHEVQTCMPHTLLHRCYEKASGEGGGREGVGGGLDWRPAETVVSFVPCLLLPEVVRSAELKRFPLKTCRPGYLLLSICWIEASSLAGFYGRNRGRSRGQREFYVNH